MAAPEKLTIEFPEQITLEFPLAGIGSRFLAIAFDTLLQAAALASLVIVALAAGLFMNATGGPSFAVSGVWLTAILIFRVVRHLHRLLRDLRVDLERPDARKTARGCGDRRVRRTGDGLRVDPPQPAAPGRSAPGNIRHRHHQRALHGAAAAARRHRRRYRRRARAPRGGDVCAGLHARDSGARRPQARDGRHHPDRSVPGAARQSIRSCGATPRGGSPRA